MRARKVAISAIHLNSDQVVTTQEEVKSAAVWHFPALFSAGAPSSDDGLLDFIPSLVTVEENALLLSPLSISEVHHAVLSIPRERYASPQSLHHLSHCPYSETEAPQSFVDFRPISLCNVVYKIFAKIIASCLSKLLPSLISLEQGAFVQGRSIAENITLSQELIQDISKRVRGGNIVLKLDREKAYDRVDWFFLKCVLQWFGFSGQWITLVERCWKNILSQGFKRLVETGSCLPCRGRGGTVLVSHLLFADDTLLFLNGGICSIRATKQFLERYQQVSGQKVNIQKSFFIHSEVMAPSQTASIRRELGMRASVDGFTYLGVPISVGHWKKDAFQRIVDVVATRISGWKARLLSMAGRLILVNHVLTSIPVHTITATHVPVYVIHKLESLFANFIWGWAEGKKKLHWRSWAEICVPKEEGGLGIRRLHDVMTAFRTKMAWGAVPVDDAVKTRGVQLVSKCYYCFQDSNDQPDIETINHTFLFSGRAASVWRHFAREYGVTLSSGGSVLERLATWWDSRATTTNSAPFRAIIPCFILWELWRARNSSKFDNSNPSLVSIILRTAGWVNWIVRTWNLRARNLGISRDFSSLEISAHLRVFHATQVVHWKRPSPGWVKLNVDGSSRGNPGMAGSGGVYKGENGDLRFAFSASYGMASNTWAELRAVHDGLTLCFQQGLTKIVVESDSLLVVN
ncbi:uncharacterized protein LOC131228795 [Magnolia sinica]|uniref:uncharacterized protein LOC131228795 n=1 Tax=Magnolia sinica TaxID=86752 RepID=UPI0026598B1A|nr:uncharacterized protein LOC131228795 [Magnolia sinica]